MKKVAFLFIFILIAQQISAQKVSSRILDFDEIDQVFTEDVKSDLGIKYALIKVYEIKDYEGTHFLVLSENIYRVTKDNYYNNKIAAYFVSVKDNKLNLIWKMQDFKLAINAFNNKETNIKFLYDFIKIADLDKDGVADPVLTYSTEAANGTDDGRLKILVYRNHKKYGIRHQNSSLDYLRSTQVDEEFYLLPSIFQTEIYKIMVNISAQNKAIFPAGYKEKMKQKRTSFDEN